MWEGLWVVYLPEDEPFDTNISCVCQRERERDLGGWEVEGTSLSEWTETLYFFLQHWPQIELSFCCIQDRASLL